MNAYGHIKALLNEAVYDRKGQAEGEIECRTGRFTIWVLKSVKNVVETVDP